MRERVGMRAAGETQNRCNDKNSSPLKKKRKKKKATLPLPPATLPVDQ